MMAQPAGGVSDSMDSRRHMDVTARARTTVNEAKRYTKFVAVMKRVLTIAAVALLCAVLAYSLAPRRQDRVAIAFQKLGIVNNDLAMIKPKLTGADTKGSPYVITADQAIQDAKNTHRARLQHVEADLTSRTNGWINVEAPSGFLDATTNKLNLYGPIAMFTDSGYEAHSDLANIDLNTGVVVGPHRVIGQGPLGTFVADRFRVERANPACVSKKGAKPEAARSAKCPQAASDANDSKIYLIGNVHMIIEQKKKTAKK